MNGLQSSVIAVLAVLLCTTGSDGLKFKGPCKKDGPNVPGAFRPQCTNSGFFKLVQHHGSTGYAFCVHPEFGVKIPGSDKGPGQGAPQCGACLHALSAFLSVGPVVGRPKPDCDGQGKFKPLQFSPSSGYSWCVDRETGSKIPGTEVAPGAGQANCDGQFPVPAPVGFQGPCTTVSQSNPGPVGGYSPQCTQFGFFNVLQRHGGTGYSWCVNPETGLKNEKSVKAPGAGDPECGKCHGELSEFLAAGPVIGRVKPACNDDGDYQALQFSPSSGYTWCVDAKTGQKIEGSEVGPADGQAKCDSQPQGPCELEKASSKPLLGTFVPKCDAKGFYASIQEHEGRRFCFDTNTGKQLPNSPSIGFGETGQKLPCEN